MMIELNFKLKYINDVTILILIGQNKRLKKIRNEESKWFFFVVSFS